MKDRKGKDTEDRAVVIVPVYNREDLVLRSLESISSQDWRPLRIIVVDNASTDDSFRVVDEWRKGQADPELRIDLLTENRRGAAAARKRGFEESEEEIVFFFDSDDAMRPGLIRSAMEAFRENPELELVGWPVVIHHLDGVERRTHSWTPADRLEKHLVHAIYRTQGVAVRRGLHERAGGWDPEDPVWNDWALGCRYLLQNPKERVLPEPLVDVYAQAQSITGTDFHSRAAMWEEILRKVALSADPHWHALIAYRAVILAACYKREGDSEAASRLLQETLAEPSLTRRQRLALRLAYAYTARGHRGAYRLIAPFL